ncbi:hypothetical protein ACJJIP_10795 [Microbulbifer sp. VTAC004]|uniref:hypothetical protein n=1 Tax=Microbulbifer TaxID=48073 RepID=UPI00036D23E0|nr:hypothetical protein [Microbulbifer variabilis]
MCTANRLLQPQSHPNMPALGRASDVAARVEDRAGDEGVSVVLGEMVDDWETCAQIPRP